MIYIINIYRNFAENKGIFYPGALNISVHDVNGNLVDILDKSPMPNFSSVNTSGIATLVNPQYLASVNHNDAYGYTNIYFGRPARGVAGSAGNKGWRKPMLHREARNEP